MANGELAIIPHGAGLTILDDPATFSRPLNEVLAEVGYAGIGALVYNRGGSGYCLVCG